MFRRRSADREAEPDKLVAVERLFAGSEKEQAEAVLEHLGTSLPGDVRGYVVVNEPNGYRFLAQRGTRRNSSRLSRNTDPGAIRARASFPT